MEIQSDQGITFNEKPNMKALEIGEKARDAILSGKYDQVATPLILLRTQLFLNNLLSIFSSWLQVRVNLPNGDMVGHTGDIQATILGCEAADKAVKVNLLLLFSLAHIKVIVFLSLGVVYVHLLAHLCF